MGFPWQACKKPTGEGRCLSEPQVQSNSECEIKCVWEDAETTKEKASEYL